MLSRNSTSNGAVRSLPTSQLPPFQNITGKIIDEMALNGTGPCYEHHTNSTKVIGFPDNVEALTLSTNVLHKLWLQSYDSEGGRRCAGGDYYELDLASSLWKSRPQIEDFRNGTYGVQFMVPETYAGSFNFSAYLLFDAYHGLDRDGRSFKIATLTVSLRINFANEAANAAIANTSTTAMAATVGDLKRCDPAMDFKAHAWTGRWSRPVENDTCVADQGGRYAHCFSNTEQIPCRKPSWCSGNVSRLESVGWSYSAHCAFHIFAPQEAWDCLAGRWLFFWGDSNHQDTIRNLLTFILDIKPPPGRDFLHFFVDRSFQNWFRNPQNLEQEVRITSHYNGHAMVDDNGLGLDSLTSPEYRNYITNFFKANRYPDTVIMNSGLHDGQLHRDIPSFVRSVKFALTYWSDLVGNVTSKPPRLLYRTTIAPAGVYRGLPSNPQKMEVYNRILAEQVQVRFPDVQLVDAFDMSFPFHYDNHYSDGGHYGRPPQGDHHYFVDVMLGHVLLNALCPMQGRA